jgi:hypothetical protein
MAELLGANAVQYAAGLALAGSLALLVRNARRGSVSVLEGAAVATFSVLTAVAVVSSHSVRQDLVYYGRGGSAFVLAAVMLGSAFTVPFTEQFARQQVDRRYWGSPVFRATNRRISLLWAGLIAVMATSHLAAGALAASGHDRPLLRIALNWGVPVLVLMRGLAATERVASEQGVSALGGAGGVGGAGSVA